MTKQQQQCTFFCCCCNSTWKFSTILANHIQHTPPLSSSSSLIIIHVVFHCTHTHLLLIVVIFHFLIRLFDLIRFVFPFDSIFFLWFDLIVLSGRTNRPNKLNTHTQYNYPLLHATNKKTMFDDNDDDDLFCFCLF